MTIDAWTNERHDAACTAVERRATATDAELMDALAMRIERLGKLLSDDVKDGTRHSITLLLAELGKRHGEGAGM